MKKQILVYGFMAVALASGCGPKSSSSPDAPAASTQVVYQQTPAGAVITPPPGGTPTGPSGGGTTTCSKPAGSPITRPVYTYSISGHGNTTVDTNFGEVITTADQMIKIQLEPGQATASQGVGGVQNYNLFGADITLLKNGSPVATFTYPGGVDSWGYRNGISVGAKHTRDFSQHAHTANAVYSVRVSNIMTSAQCQTACSTSNTTYYQHYSVDYWTCQSWTSYGYFWTGYSCYGPNYTLINQCKQLNCNIGSAISSAGWSATIRVETDTTECLPQ